MEKLESPSSDFDIIAPSWYNFRHHTIFQAELRALAMRWQGGPLLNLGCGHGADFLPFKNGFELHGLDYSAGMLLQAERFASKHSLTLTLKQADLRVLPYPDNSFEHVIAIATFHHLKGNTEQLKALQELYRVLKPGGESFITVWNRCQTRFWFKRKEILLPFKADGKEVTRYYYLFTFGELERLVKKIGFKIIHSSPESRYHFPLRTFARNICLLLKKTK
ncbi:MAG: class I SAM-dependent methyltransferase [Dehalococcoidia bacterium]|nr:class I SAM-dependent methyltransferase [Dehalococcoidia bacterium]